MMVLTVNIVEAFVFPSLYSIRILYVSMQILILLARNYTRTLLGTV